MKGTPDGRPVCVVGNLTLDDTFTPHGSFPAAPGGDALYAALGLRWWGLPVSILSRVGDDYPQDHLRRIEAAGIGVATIRRMPGPTVHYRVTYEADSRVFEHLTRPERLDELSPTGAELEAIEGVPWVHVAAMPIDRQTEAVHRARDAKVPFSLDPHEEYIAPVIAQLQELIDGSVFLPSELEAGLLLPGMTPKAALGRFAQLGARAAVIKQGIRGSWVMADGQAWQVPALPIAAVDPTGAGDAYCGGFVAGFLWTDSALGGAACGTVSAAHIVQGFGAFHSDRPTPAWMEAGLRTLLEGRYAGEGDRVLARLLLRPDEMASP